MKTLPDAETERSLKALAAAQDIKKNQVENVRAVLVVISGVAATLDLDALRHKITRVYQQAAVFFQSSIGRPLGATPPERVDLLIDFSAPGQREGWFQAKKLRKLARFAVGRDAGWFRKKIFDRVIDESDLRSNPDMLERERVAQRRVLEAVGVGLMPQADTTQDRSHEIALELPPLA